MTLHFAVSDSPDFPGLYTWELRDHGFTASGCASTINKCLTAIAGARLRIEAHLAEHPHPESAFQPDLPLHSPPVLQVHPPHGRPLPAQQDIPATGAHRETSASIYPRPSKTG